MPNERIQFRKYIFQSLICAAVIALVCVSILVASYNPSDYAASLQDKLARLETTTEPRLIIVGGSSAALGIDSPRIEQETGLHPINMGVYGAVGLRFMLLELKGHLRTGDVVLIAPEYQTLQQPAYGDGFYLMETIHANPSLIKNVLTPHSLVVMARYFPSFMRQQVEKLFTAPIPPSQQTPAQKMSTRGAFNSYGDVDTSLAGDMHMNDLRPTEAAGLVRPSADPGVLSLLHSFVEQSTSQGIAVYLLPPSVPEAMYNANSAAIAAQDAQIREAVGTERVLGTPEDMVFSYKDFLDVEHPNQAGKERKTAVLIPLLKEKLYH